MMLNPLAFARSATDAARDPPAPLVVAALLLAVAGGGWLAPVAWHPAAAAAFSLHCTNPASGTKWQVVVDPDRGLVDSQAATITDRWISWHDPNQGYYDFERVTGKLRLRNASSTGGYFLYYTCSKD
jgi:hypothetical protein